MTLTTLRSAAPGVISNWHSSVAGLPPECRPATPFHTREWAAAWQSVRTEQVTTRRHLLIQDGPHRRHRMSFSLVRTSPLWRGLEAAAGVSQPTFRTDVLFAPSPYSQYGGLPGARGPVLAEVLERGRALARDLGSDALVLTNLPPAERALWRQVRPPNAEIALSWAHRVCLDNTFNGFLARIPSSQVRRDFRAAHRRGKEAGLTLTVAHGPELLPLLPRLMPLLRSGGAHGRSGVYGTDVIASLTRVPGALGLLAQDPTGALVDGFIAFAHGRTLYLWGAADARARTHDPDTRHWLMYESLKYAIAGGMKALDTGRDLYPWAGRLGMLPVALTSAVYLARPNDPLINRVCALQTGLRRRSPGVSAV
ncbi:GNAT family N-acetyltransferase [Streptomyces sp. MNP-20]|uniref:GNAT family N-acetyltransferase n=1 Tax=Streptomyces sp. MNP-20 TaxID=2721165 RepID=UPI00155815D9|nr:GNAT family N-acetyltransferase [Streptomyces sp. MNP-20]